MPGPLLTATISESSRHGTIAGPLLIIGHGILELALVIALMLGLAPYLKRESIFIVTAIIGSTILLWMAITMFKAMPSLTVKWDSPPSRHNRLILSGILLSLANPYWTVWWVSIGLGYILYSMKFGYLGVLFFFVGHIAADLGWYTVVSITVGKGRHFLTDRVYRSVIGICAAILLFFSGYFAYAGIHKFIS